MTFQVLIGLCVVITQMCTIQLSRRGYVTVKVGCNNVAHVVLVIMDVGTRQTPIYSTRLRSILEKRLYHHTHYNVE